jgi:hypothetical protein
MRICIDTRAAGLTLVAVVGAAVATQWPELQRYLKIRSM